MKKLLILLCCTFNVGAYAAEIECELKYESPSDIAGCYEKQSFSKVKKEYSQLENITKKVMPNDKSALTLLVESQKAWLKYRNSYCESYVNYHGEINNHANCIVDLNNKRAEQLKSDSKAF